MALSNTFREPRRELTEQGIGLIVLSALLVPAHYFAQWLSMAGPNAPPIFVCYVLAVVVEFLAILVLFGAAHLMHWLGEISCSALARGGLELRPKNRFR